MYSRVRDPVIQHTNLLLFQISKKLFERDDILVSDMNAAKDGALIGSWQEILPKLLADEIYTKSWNDPDDEIRKRKMARMMAEVLIPDCVSVDLIIGVVVSGYRTSDRANRLGLPNVRISSGYFFETDSGAKVPWAE